MTSPGRAGVQVSQPLTVPSGAAVGTPGAAPITGSIDITGMGEAVVLTGPERLMLKLADGRRLMFTLSSTSGRIRSAGIIEDV
jgi:hypothetical protein